MADQPQIDVIEGAKTIERNVGHLRERLGAWAAHMAARYNGPVYLCGSTLHHPTPRDCDIRIIMSDTTFGARYGMELHPMDLDEFHPLRKRRGLVRSSVIRWSDEGPTQRWIDDIAKFNDHLAQTLALNMDVQAWPESVWREVYPTPVRLAAPTPRWWIYTKYCPDPSAPIEVTADV